jgi:hypothetical protein
MLQVDEGCDRPERTRGERKIVTGADRRTVLDGPTCEHLTTMYGGWSVQHLGGTTAAAWALALVQRYVWVEGTKETRNSQMRKFRTFMTEEGRGMPPGEVDLCAYVAWLLVDGKVSVASFENYLSAVRRFCESEKLLPLPPTPRQSRLLGDMLRAAAKLEADMSVKEKWKRAGISAAHSLTVLLFEPESRDLRLRRRKASWQPGFCFSFRGGTCGALWPKDFKFTSAFEMSIKPDVLKRTTEDRTLNPEERPYCVPVDTPPEKNPVLFVQSVVEEFEREYGPEACIFGPDPMTCGTTDFITEEIVAMADLAGIEHPSGMRFTSHSLRRGMLSEFILMSPVPDRLVIARRLDWNGDHSVVYFCRQVVRSEASLIYVPGALQVHLPLGA